MFSSPCMQKKNSFHGLLYILWTIVIIWWMNKYDKFRITQAYYPNILLLLSTVSLRSSLVRLLFPLCDALSFDDFVFMPLASLPFFNEGCCQKVFVFTSNSGQIKYPAYIVYCIKCWKLFKFYTTVICIVLWCKCLICYLFLLKLFSFLFLLLFREMKLLMLLFLFPLLPNRLKKGFLWSETCVCLLVLILFS